MRDNVNSLPNQALPSISYPGSVVCTLLHHWFEPQHHAVARISRDSCRFSFGWERQIQSYSQIKTMHVVIGKKPIKFKNEATHIILHQKNNPKIE